jgi:hypothetical protein
MATSYAGLWPESDCSWQGPEAIVRVNYIPILSSERAPHIKEPAIDRYGEKIWTWAPDGSAIQRQTGRLAEGRNLISTSTSTSY